MNRVRCRRKSWTKSRSSGTRPEKSKDDGVVAGIDKIHRMLSDIHVLTVGVMLSSLSMPSNMTGVIWSFWKQPT